MEQDVIFLKSNLFKIVAVLVSLSLLTAILSSCKPDPDQNSTTLETMAPVDDVWREGLSRDKITTPNTLSPEEITKIVKEALGPDSKWDGNYIKLSPAEKEIIKAYFSKNGYAINILGAKPLLSPDKYEPVIPVSTKTLSGLIAGSPIGFGGSGNSMFERVAPTKDGGYVITGFFSTVSGDCAEAGEDWTGTKSSLVKYDKDGNLQWKAFLGGDGGGVNFRGLTVLADDSIIVSGDTKAPSVGAKNDKFFDALLVKYSPSGKQEWIKTMSGSESEWFSCVAATPDGGFIAGGKAESSDGDFEDLKDDNIKAILVKFDADGGVRWKRSVSGTKSSEFEGLSVNGNGDIFAVCKTAASDGDFEALAGRGQLDTLVFSYDKNGTLNWASSFSGSGSDELIAVAASPDGGCVIAGKYSIDIMVDGSFSAYHNAGSFDSFIVKFNKNGTVGWAKPVAGLDSEEITGITAVDGGYAAVGITSSANRDFATIGNKGGRDGFIILIDELGETIAMESISGTTEDVPRAVTSTDDGRVIVVGGTNSNDLFFAGMKPAANKILFNCYSVTFTLKWGKDGT